jgi:hypothetical protein
MSESQSSYGNNPFSDLAQFEAINFDVDLKDVAKEEMKQKTIEWFLARWDKFTGSRIPDLMKQGRGKGEEFGETAKGIIMELAAYHQMTDEGREMYAVEQMYKEFRQTAWGNRYEPEARLKYNPETTETGFTVHPTIPYFGGSFDGRVEGGIIEIKCPYDPVKHMKNRKLKQSGGIDSKYEYYGQIQANIEVAGVQWCDFISYDPRCKPEYQLVVIRVERDETYIAVMLERIHEAKRKLDKFLEGGAL